MSSEPTFEQLINELERICNQLEKGKLSLEKSLELYARGVEIEMKLKQMMNSAERRVVEIINPDGSIEPFEIPPKR